MNHHRTLITSRIAGCLLLLFSALQASAQSKSIASPDTTRRAPLSPQSAQTNSVSDDLLKSVLHPSPQSAAYARYGEYPVDYSTGVPRIDIPLYTLDTGDYQLPISLSYHASGIKVTDVSTPVGLGWVLNAGGVISRSSRGVPDKVSSLYALCLRSREEAQQMLDQSTRNKDWWERILSGFPTSDTETDRYSYNLPGKAGIFRYDSSDGKIYAIPHDPIKIEETTNGYRITDTDGTVYTFETAETSGGSTGTTYKSAYYLTSIVTGERHNTITFTYGQNSYCQVNYRAESYYNADNYEWDGSMPVPARTPSSFDMGAGMTTCTLQNYNHTTPLLTGISWNGISVSISYATDRLDAQRHRMTTLTVTDGGNPVRHVTLDNNSYFGNTTRNYRMKLSGLTVRGSASQLSPAETWSFSYNSLTPADHYTYTNVTVASTRTYEDYWGYWNGRTSTHVIPDGVIPGMTTADRRSAENYMKMCSLESITFPTGGRTVFTMEANRVGSTIIGGLRVSDISSYDIDGTLLERRSYEYSQAHQQVAPDDDLYCWEEDVQLFSQGNSGIDSSIHTGHADGFFASASPILPLTGMSGAPVNYLSVTEYIGGTASSNLGKNVHSFILDTEGSYPGSDEDYYNPPLPKHYYSNFYNNDEGNVPVLPSSREAWRREPSGSYTRVQTEQYSYAEQTPLHPYYTTGVRVARRGVANIYSNTSGYEYAPFGSSQDYWDSYIFTNCRAYRKPRLLTGKTVTDHTTGVSVTTTYTYDSGTLRTLKPLSESVINSDGNAAKTEYEYSFNTDGSTYVSMAAANIVDIPIKEKQSYGGSLQRTRETSRAVFNGNMYLPSVLKETVGSTTRTLITYDAYDSSGNLRHAKVLDDMHYTFLWGYGSRYPVACIEGLTWSQVQSTVGMSLINNLAACSTTNAHTLLTSLRSAVVSPSSLSGTPHLVSTFMYSPGVGIAAETSPDGATKSYTYDALGRLTSMTDEQGEVESYSYSFASGSLPNNVLRSVKKNASVYDTDRLETSIWYDGIGRPVEELSIKVTAMETNLATRTEYDLAGRQTRKWLPVVTESIYLRAPAIETAARSTYGTSESRPFTEQVVEASPLGRTPYVYGPGAAWYAASGGGHPVRTEWLGNTTSGVLTCKHYFIDEASSLAEGSSNYGAGTLTAVRTTDEDGKTGIVFTDKLGRTVMTRQVDGSSTFSDTYYVYDKRGQLRFVLQPKYQESADLDRYAFQYTYDDRGNMIRKKLPGAAYVDYVYDANDRLKYSQDGRRRSAGSNRWRYYRYDNLGRVTEEGECTGQSETSSPSVLVRNYYDDYSFSGTPDFPGGYFPSSGPWAMGRKTGQRLSVLGGMAAADPVTGAWYYDSRGQVVKEVRGHHGGLGYETRVLAYTYTGQTASVTTTRSMLVSGVPASETRSLEYDLADRLASESLELPGVSNAVTGSYVYDNLGRLSSHRFNGSSSNAAGYSYDIRSRVTGISHPGFIQDLAYTYGSDISSYGWKRSSGDTRRAYSFSYDGLHRLRNAAYSEGGSANGRYSESVSGYDLNGNITGLQRYGRTGASSWGLIDNLGFSRDGNRLSAVTDSGASPYGGDFDAKAGSRSYDANGSMTYDSGRGISSITWNEIGLPKIVTFSNGATISYLYAADGTKLREVRNVSGTTTTIDWCGDLVLEKVGSGARSARRLNFNHGYVDLQSGNSARRYYVRDHLGSVRAVVNDGGTTLEADDYYPLGGPLPSATSSIQPEKYQGKDWNPAAGFNVYDFGARLYDPSVGLWLSQDPMAEKYYGVSPYAFCGDNPMVYVDPDGNIIWKPVVKVVAKTVISAGISGAIAYQQGARGRDLVGAIVSGGFEGAVGELIKVEKTAKVIVGAITGATSKLIEQGIRNEGIDWNEVLKSAGTEGAFSAASAGNKWVSDKVLNKIDEYFSSSATYSTLRNEVKSEMRRSGQSMAGSKGNREINKRVEERISNTEAAERIFVKEYNKTVDGLLDILKTYLKSQDEDY